MKDFRIPLVAASFLVAGPTHGAPAESSNEWSLSSAVEEIRLVLTESTPIQTTYTTTVRSIYEEKRYESSPKVVTPYFRRPREYFYTDYDSAPVVFDARQDHGFVSALQGLLHAFVGGSDDA